MSLRSRVFFGFEYVQSPRWAAGSEEESVSYGQLLTNNSWWMDAPAFSLLRGVSSEFCSMAILKGGLWLLLPFATALVAYFLIALEAEVCSPFLWAGSKVEGYPPSGSSSGISAGFSSSFCCLLTFLGCGHITPFSDFMVMLPSPV